MPKALVVAYYFPPVGGGGTLRTLKFVQYLPDFGWEPHVLTPKHRAYAVTDPALAELVSPQTHVHETPAWLPTNFFRRITRHQPGATGMGPALRGGLLALPKNLIYTCCFIPDEFIGWMPFAVSRGRKVVRAVRPDLILTTGPPNSCHLIGRKLAAATGLPWVADLRDLWDMYPDSYNPFGFEWRRRLDDARERDVLSRADQLIVVTDEMRTHLLQKLPGVSPSRVHVITNGFDPADFEETARPQEEKKFTIVHAGTLFRWRSLEPFLLGLQKLFEKHPAWKPFFKVKLLGMVPDTEKRRIAQTEFADLFEMPGYCSHRETLAQLQAADILLLVTGDLPHCREMIPGKLFDYIGARRQILAISPPGSVHRLFERERLGRVYAPEETQLIARALDRWFVQHQNGGIRPLRVPSLKYHRRYLTRRLVGVFQSTIQAKP